MSNLLLQKIVLLRVTEVVKIILKKKRPLLLARSVHANCIAYHLEIWFLWENKTIMRFILNCRFWGLHDYCGITEYCWSQIPREIQREHYQ